MTINLMSNFQKNIKKIIFLTMIILFPYLSSAQNCLILDTLIIDNFCWDPALSAGNLTIVPIDPNADYNYSIDGGVTIIPAGANDSVFAVSSGTFYIWLQEVANPGCFFSDTLIISNPQDPITTVTNVSNNLICNGDSTGGGEVNAIGGVLPYTYLWESTGATTNVVSILPAGYHVVEVTDANGCSVVDSILIQNIYDPFNIDLDTLQQVQCNGECNGEVVLNVNSGGVAPYTFSWSTGQNYFGPGPDTLLGLCQGGYQVIIADAFGCDTVVAFIISEPSELAAEAIIIQPVQCFGADDGVAYAIGSGGTGNGNANDYTYSWSPILESNDTITNLTPVIHTVLVTDTNGCTASDTVLITEPNQLYVEIPDSSAIYSYCLNTYTGTLVAEAYGGTPGYYYSWDNTVQLTDSVVNLHAGIYTVTVFDDRACTASATFDLDSITNTFIADSVNFNVIHVSCYGLYDGSIDITGISGSEYSPYLYTWTGPSPFTTINSSLVEELYEGNYAVTIQDDLGCTMIFDTYVDQPEILEYGVNYTVNESCAGTIGSSCNGSVIMNISGGSSPYYYDNSFSGTFPISTANQTLVVNDSLMSGFCNGIYNIDITDDYGCQGYVQFGASFLANVGSDVQVGNPGVVPAIPTTSCFNTADGSAFISGGANPLFNYTWESDNFGSSSGIVLGTGGSYIDFVAGDYWLVAHYSDAASFGVNYSACDVSYDFTVIEGNIIFSGAVITNPTCYGDANGSINLNPISSSTAPPFSFLWDTLTSILPINYTSEDLSQLAPGIYTVSITDADGCVLVESFHVNEPSPIVANFINLNNVSCEGDGDGSVTVLVDPSSGQAPYIYSWNTNPTQTTSNASMLSGGIYTVMVTDSAGFGCSANFNVTIVEPTEILASVEPNSFWGEDDTGNPFHISCHGYSDGSIVVSSVGGTGTVNFDWQNFLGITISTSQIANNLSSGSYTLFVTDANGCPEDTTIILNEPDQISPNIQVELYDFNSDGIGTEVSCFGLFDGWALSDPYGGYPGAQGYSYTWVNSNGQDISSQALAANLPALLSYNVTVTDMNGCTNDTNTAIFTQPLLFDANVTTTNYAGATHAPFSVSFVDSTISIDPFYFNWTWEDGFDFYASGITSMNHSFTTNNIGLNEVYVVLTNATTGCMDTVFFDIDVQGVPDINNVFTPNSDGINDEFQFGEFGMKTVSIEIYNRWGQMVYAWDGTDKSWSGIDISGQDVPEGAYFYALVAEGEDGHFYDKKGSVTLLR